jgi:hypothetical protein
MAIYILLILSDGAQSEFNHGLGCVESIRSLSVFGPRICAIHMICLDSIRTQLGHAPKLGPCKVLVGQSMESVQNRWPSVKTSNISATHLNMGSPHLAVSNITQPQGLAFVPEHAPSLSAHASPVPLVESSQLPLAFMHMGLYPHRKLGGAGARRYGGKDRTTGTLGSSTHRKHSHHSQCMGQGVLNS